MALKQLDLAWIEDAVKSIVEHERKIVTNQFKEKLLQFFDTSNLRFGVMLVGPPNGGKTYI